MPIDSELRITSPTGGEFALCSAEATRRIDPYVVPAKAVAVEVRGASTASRQINNFLSASYWEADKLIAVEVITPEGGWSSYPAHKHDEVSATRSNSRRSTTSGSPATTDQASSPATQLMEQSTKPLRSTTGIPFSYHTAFMARQQHFPGIICIT